MSDLKDELEQERRSKEWAETWTPDGPGDMLIGTLEGYDEAETDFGVYPVAHIRNESGVLKGLWLMHSVLQNEWEEADPDPGDKVGALYHGQRSGEDFDYHMWTVKVDRPEEADTADRSAEEPKRDPPEFEGDQLFGEPSDGDSTLDDPNGELPY